MKNKKFWQWKNQLVNENGNAERVLEINGTIAEDSWFDDEVTPKLFKEELFAGSGDVVMLIMLDTGLSLDVSTFLNAFSQVMGGNVDFTLN